jgi:DNA-binding PadR family transcriptional regulator
MSASLGELEQLVLLALLHLGDEAYGITVRDEIAARAGQDVPLGSIYNALSRLEAKGLVSAWMGDPTPERGGRRKRHYRVLPSGRRALARSLAAIRRLTAGLQTVLRLP